MHSSSVCARLKYLWGRQGLGQGHEGNDGYYFVLALNREVEGPESENMPNWSL